ncbi:MAG: zinc-binding protein [Chlamydiae bacterium]|nr:zinc-binding protein [Chlamydiota bacterium]
MGILVMAIIDGLKPVKVASTKGGEYHSPCPSCGGKDRFIIWTKPNRYYCRQCGKFGDEIQYSRDFHGLSYAEACKKSGAIPKAFLERAHTQEKRSVYRFEPQEAKLPSLQWRRQAGSFTLYCQEQLKKSSPALELFYQRGFSSTSLEQFHLGWNPTSLWLHRNHWGMDPSDKKLWIPKGLVIPTYDTLTGEVIKLKIRRSDWTEGDKLPKYVEVSGSMQKPALYGDWEGKPIIIVESELDAMLLHQFASDLSVSMALGGASKRPDLLTHELLIRAPKVLFSLDVDSAGAKAYQWWRNVYPHIELCLPPVGKSLGDAYEKGVDLRKWIVEAIGL